MSKKITVISIIWFVLGSFSIPGGMYLNNFIANLTYSSMDDGLLGIRNEATPLIKPLVKEYGVAESLDQILDIGGPAVAKMVKQIGPAKVLSIIKDSGGLAVKDMIKKIGPAMLLSTIKNIGGSAVEKIIKQIGPAKILSTIKDIGSPAVEDFIKKIGPAIVLSKIKDIGGPAIQNIIKEIGPSIALPIIRNSSIPLIEDMVKATFASYIMNMMFNGLNIKTKVDGKDVSVVCPAASFHSLFNDPNYRFCIKGKVSIPVIKDPEFDVLQINGISKTTGNNLGFYSRACSRLVWGQDIKYSGLDGGGGGGWFDDTIRIKGCPMVTQIRLKGGKYVDNIGFTLTNGVKFYHGGGGGNTKYLNLQPGEYVKKMQLRTGKYIDNIKLTTNKGRVIQVGRGGGGLRSEKVAPTGWQIIGFYGRSGRYVDKLGAIYAPVVSNPKDWKPLETALTLDTASGSGVLRFLESYKKASSSGYQRTRMEQEYRCNWNQLRGVKRYIDYLYNTMIPTIINGVDVHVVVKVLFIPFYDKWHHVDILKELMPELAGSNSVTEIAERIFFELWSEGTALGNVIYKGGLDFGELINSIEKGTKGFEAGLDSSGNRRALGLSTNLCKLLWNENDDKSFTNLNGIKQWYKAKTDVEIRNNLKNSFSLTNTQINNILDWLWAPGRFSDTTLPKLLKAPNPYGFGVKLEELAHLILYEQWANLKVLDMDLYPKGLDFGELINGFSKGTKGFEAGLDRWGNSNPLNLAISKVKKLWDETNEFSLTNLDGIIKWYEAKNDLSISKDLKNKFQLTNIQMNKILDWLWAPGRFADGMLSKLIEAPKPYGYGVTLEDLAIQILYELWADGTVLGMPLFPEGLDFGDLIENMPQGTKGFEAGFSESLGLTFDECLALWDENNPLALTNIDGIKVWYEAKDYQTSLYSDKNYQGNNITIGIGDYRWIPNIGMTNDVLSSVKMPDTLRVILYEHYNFGGRSFTLNDDISNFDDFNVSSLKVKLKNEYGGINPRTNLATEFQLNNFQICRILDWLWAPNKFAEGLLPKLIQAPKPYGYGVSLEELAIQILYEQWANGTILGMNLYPEGLDFSDLIENIPKETYGFEVGLHSSLDLSLEKCNALWNEMDEFSLTNIKGIEKWYDAKNDDAIKNTLKIRFSITYFQINKILDWLWGPNKFAEGLLPKLIEAPKPYGYGVSLDTLAIQILLEQWANGTILGMNQYPDGLDFGELIECIPKNTKGFELKQSGSVGIKIDECLMLWNQTNPLSLTHIDGIRIWYGANASISDRERLLDSFPFLSDIQLEAILEWLWYPGRFSDITLPKLIQAPKPYGYGVPLEELAIQILYEQWANGTIIGMSLYPDGIDFNALLGGFNYPVSGFEVGILNSTDLTLEQCKELWNSDNPFSFLNLMEGIPTWKDAKSNIITRQILMNEFGINHNQINMLLDWLWSPGRFSDYMVPILIESDHGYGLPLDEFCNRLLLEQWANGTVFGEVMFPDPGFALPLGDLKIYGFEVGIQIPTRMSMDSALSLWNEQSEFSLVNPDGVKKWRKATAGDTALIEELRIANGLDSHAIDLLLKWIPHFQHEIMPFLAQYAYDLPMDTLSLGILIQSITSIFGGSCIAISAVCLTTNIVTKKKRSAKQVKISGKISKYVFNEGIKDKKYNDPDYTEAPKEFLNKKP